MDFWMKVSTSLQTRLQFVLSHYDIFVTCFLYEISEISMLFVGGLKINEVDPDCMSLFNSIFIKSHFFIFTCIGLFVLICD
jgi:hypothetical protein